MSLFLRLSPLMDCSRWKQHFWESCIQCSEAEEELSLPCGSSKERAIFSQKPTNRLCPCLLGLGKGTTMMALDQWNLPWNPTWRQAASFGMYVEGREKLNEIWILLKRRKGGRNACSECNMILPRLELAKDYSSYLLYMWV